MFKFKKNALFILLTTCFITFSSANVFFNSNFEIGLFTPDSDSFSVNTEANFSSHIQIGNNFTLESDFAVTIESFFADAFFQNVPSLFSINKIRTSYNFSDITFPTRVDLFIGNHDSMGNHLLFQKYFGIKNTDSPFFATEFGKSSTGMITINGYGVEVGTIFLPKMVNSFYFYVNKLYNNNQITIDTRLSYTNETFLGDLLLGFSFPIDTFHYTLQDGLTLPINRAEFHFVSDMLFGDNSYMQFHMQLGITRLQLKPPTGEEVFNVKDVHLFLEPRISFNNIKTNFSLFLLSETATKTAPYAEYPLGGALYIAGITNFDNTLAEFGGHISITTDILNNENNSQLSLVIAPFANFTFNNSQVNISLPLKPLSNNISKMFSFSVSYSANF